MLKNLKKGSIKVTIIDAREVCELLGTPVLEQSKSNTTNIPNTNYGKEVPNA